MHSGGFELTKLTYIPGSRITWYPTEARAALGFVTKRYTRTPGIVAVLQKEATEVPGWGIGILQNLQKFRVRYRSVTELTEVPGIVARGVRNSHKL